MAQYIPVRSGSRKDYEALHKVYRKKEIVWEEARLAKLVFG
jgi:hypothetical protein